MRGTTRRGGDTLTVSLRDFGWDAPAVAALRHSSLPWYDAFDPVVSITATPLPSLRASGTRDGLSLLGQFAAHQSFLQFAGMSDGAFSAADWAVVRKRGADWRLIRVSFRPCTPDAAPPVLALAQQFAELVGISDVEVLRQSWARPETLYGEIHARLHADVAADLRWLTESACGEERAPGADSLRAILSGPPEEIGYGEAIVADTFAALQKLEPTTRIVTAGCQFPLQRYAALASIDGALLNSLLSETAVAERLARVFADRRSVVVVQGPECLDESSRRVLEILGAMSVATLLTRTAPSALPPTRLFVLSPRLAAGKLLDDRLAAERDAREWVQRFVRSSDFARYLATGELPADDSAFARVPEPRRSYVAALALLGSIVPRATGSRFLAEFLFDQPLEDLAIDGVTAVDDSTFRFVSEEMRRKCERHIPAASRPALCRAAAAIAEPLRAAFLLIDAGEPERGLSILEDLEWSTPDDAVRALSAIARGSLTPPLAWTLCNALVDGGRYRDAREATPALSDDDRELVLARIDRRTGDYETALLRLERISSLPFEAQILLAELLRLAARFDEADTALQRALPSTGEERLRLDYERAVLAFDRGMTADETFALDETYLASRFRTYRALERSDTDEAGREARRSIELARTTVERIDAWLDRVFASFSSGRWEETRSLAVEALIVVDEAQGDRAAAGILYTLSYLAADDGQWGIAAHAIDRLKQYYSRDAGRLFEVGLLSAHLEFSRGRFDAARHFASSVLGRDTLITQIREAAALILDEIDWVERRGDALRSKGNSSNRELGRRRNLLLHRSEHRDVNIGDRFMEGLARWEDDPSAAPPEPSTRSEGLKLFRSALHNRRRDVAERLAATLGCEVLPHKPVATTEGVEIMRAAATADFPFEPGTFGDARWAFATRNRLGHWSVDGAVDVAPTDLDVVAAGGADDWVACSDREFLFIEKSSAWPESMRSACAALFHLRAENHRLRRLVESDEELPATRADGFHGMIGNAPAIRALFDVIERVGKRDVPICILGESGTGKELVAQAIHRSSTRRQKIFTAINCAALPEALIESELFGHVRGAFTGADRDRAGLIETSDGGTLFLDEIGEMPISAQAKLLRFLQDGEFRRVGDVANRTSDVRVIAATNRKLEAAVEEGRFREDLYYRIRGVELTIPPLRDRGADVILLARHFLTAERAKHRSGPSTLSGEVDAVFRGYRWPGNVRELQNAIRAAHAMAGEAREIDLDHVPERLRHAVPARGMAGSYQDAVARFRRDLIEKSLAEASGNQNRAASLLNISRQALAYQIRELGIMVRKASPRPQV